MTHDENDHSKVILTEDDVKNALKEAIKEWLEEKYAQFGKWTIRALLASLLSAVITVIIYSNWIKLH
jgi:hypothetical protein